MNINQINPQSFKGNDLNNILKEDIKERLKDINTAGPAINTSNHMSQELTLRTALRNNIMLEQVLQNQENILENQEKILGSKLDTNA